MVEYLLNPPEFDPLDYDNLAKSCVQELMSQGPYALPLPNRFTGAGIYAIFYRGTRNSFPAYSRWAAPEADHPVYVGKAIPIGGRRGTPTSAARGSAGPLFARLSEHAGSIEAATNLDIDDFACRFLVMKPVWISLAERFVIDHWPIWNVCIDGFGNHDPGSGRHQGEVSWWDALHPGRPWAARLRQTRSQHDALQQLTTC
ncbi:MAG: Eco29kI family restriction endonuclease [Thermomicrobiales bacterium]